MARIDKEKSILESASELKINGSGLFLVASACDPYAEYNEGFIGVVPDGIVVKHLGEYPEPTPFDMAEFLAFDPSRVDVVIDIFDGNDETPAVERAQELKAQGYSGEIRPYRGHFTVWGHRPALIRAGSTS